MNDQVLDFGASLNVQKTMTGAYGPWQNVTVERLHATAEVIVQKLIENGPKMSLQYAMIKLPSPCI